MLSTATVSGDTLHSMGLVDFSGNSVATERERTCFSGLLRMQEMTLNPLEPDKITASFRLTPLPACCETLMSKEVKNGVG